MRERPIIFNSEQVLAALQSRMTQMRIPMVPQPVSFDDPTSTECLYKKGDHLWVRETWGSHYGVVYRATDEGKCCPSIGWQNPVTMPCEAARIFLELTDIRIERIQNISEADAKAEGMEPVFNGEYAGIEYRNCFQRFWNKSYSDWDSNPWVWVMVFQKIG
jgi:hypothetical protein